MKNTAIIFFSLDFHEEENNKALFGKSCAKNRSFATFLIHQSEQVLQKTGIDTFRFSKKNQVGFSFGEKLANAFESVFEQGYKQVIAVGNDTLDLRNCNWTEIVQQLKNGNCVLGPTQRGGTYLIGLTRDHFEKERFAALAWQSKHLFRDLSIFCQHKSSHIHLLHEGHEINDLNDLKQLVHSNEVHAVFHAFLTDLLRETKNDSFASVNVRVPFQLSSFKLLRAPPLFD